MRKILIGIASMTLAASAVWAEGAKPVDASKTDASKAEMPKTDTMSKTAGNEVSGQLSKFDKDSRALTIATPTGDQQSLKLASDAKITRDGSAIAVDELQPGCSVRASFDPSTKQATSIDVTSKDDKPKAK